jgi:DNA-binding transcriptional ArsR family regulator
MPPETLEAVFVQRQALAQRLVELIRESVLTPSKHHSLLIGPRGIGKTHLVSLVYHRVAAMEDLRDRLLISWLREEEWGVCSFLDLLLRVFRALVAEYCDENLAARVEALYGLHPDAAELQAAALLTEYLGDRTLLLLVENLDDLFDGLGDIGQKRLRAYLQEHPSCTILATAQSLFNGVSLQDSPFYGFFRVTHLRELGIDDAIRLLANIATLRGDEGLAEFVQSPAGRARVRAFAHLAGGNPRVYVIFSQFLTPQSLDELVEPFLSTLDSLTPYYQSRVAWLSSQQRKIVEFLCDRGGAVPVKEIAQHCFITHQTASSQLRELREKGYVRSISEGRESFYELYEPMMRLCVEVKKQRTGPIRLLVDFLRLYYLPSELMQRLNLLPSESGLDREYLEQAFRTAITDVEDPRVVACNRALQEYFEQKNYVQLLQVAEELVAYRGEALDWAFYACALSVLGRSNEAAEAASRAVSLEPMNAIIYRVSHMLEGYRRWHKGADRSEDVSLEPGPIDALTWVYRTLNLLSLGCHKEVLESYGSLPHSAQAKPGTLLFRAVALMGIERWDEGYAALDDLLTRFPSLASGDATTLILCNLFTGTHDSTVWRHRVPALIDLYKRHQALMTLGQAIVQTLHTPMFEETAQAWHDVWRDVWREAAAGYAELRLPVCLLDITVRFLKKHDLRVLLELPIEERKILEPFLGIEVP